MKLLYIFILLYFSNINSMESENFKECEKHSIHIKTQSDKHGSDSEIHINLKPETPDSPEEKQKDRDANIKIAKIAAVTGITSAILTAIVGLIVGFEACK